MYIITNPTSRKGRGEALTGLITAALDAKNEVYTLCRTSRSLHATQIAREAADMGEELVICIGGDGTVSEVAGGLAGTNTALGIIPAGTGNDFTRYLGIPKDPLEALEIALSGDTRAVDLGLANERVFINVAGSGFDVAVLHHTLFYKKIFHGLLAYVLGVLRTVFSFPQMDVTITHAGGTIRQKALVVSVANGRYFGGGMCVAPYADAGDGLFDVQYVDELPRWRIPFLLAGFIKGNYIKWPVAHHFRCDSLTVTTSDSSLQLDGEICSGREVRYKLMPQAIKIKTPRSSR